MTGVMQAWQSNEQWHNTIKSGVAGFSSLRDEVVLRAPAARDNASCEEGADECTRKKRVPWAAPYVLVEKTRSISPAESQQVAGRIQ